MPDTTVAAIVFVVTYVMIVSERVHKTAVALAGAVVMIGLHVLNQEEAFAAIDFNVIFLLAGMMMIVNILGKTGIFEWVAIRSARMGQGRPLRILIILSLVTAGGSAFLDNVTTVVLIAPVTIFVTGSLGVSAVPFLIAEALASNIGGTATLIGDPPNILIASGPADLNFNDFLLNLAPIIIIILGFWLLCVRFLFFRGVTVDEDARSRVMAMDEREVLTNPALLRTSLIVLGLTLVGFLLHGALDYEPATIALMGAAALLVITREEPHEILRDVEWSTLFFFIGLFIVVGGVEKVGILEDVGGWASDITAGSRTAATMLLLWMSALLSGIVDNIPYTTAMIPVVAEMDRGLNGDPGNKSLWWALALGADLGGNLTVIAASANVIVANLGERAGQRIPFWLFFRYGALVTIGSMLLSTLYLWLRYLL